MSGGLSSVNGFSHHTETNFGIPFNYLESKNGTDSFVNINKEEYFFNAKNSHLTLCAWVKLPAGFGAPSENDGSEERVLISYGDIIRLSVNSAYGNRSATKGNLTFVVSKNSERVVSKVRTVSDGSHVIDDDNWHFVAGVYDKDRDAAKIYIDGKRVKTTTTALSGSLVRNNYRTGCIGSMSNYNNEYLHARPTTNAASDNFNGSIGPVHLFPELKTQSELQDMMEARPNSLTPENRYLAIYPFDKVSENNVIDDSGNNIHAQLDGFTRNTEYFGGERFSYIRGNASKSCRLSLPDNLSFGSGDGNLENFTFSCWFRIPANSAGKQVIFSGSNNFMEAWVENSGSDRGKLIARIRDNSTSSHSIEMKSTGSVADNSWHLLSLRVNATKGSIGLLIDGAQNAVKAVEPSLYFGKSNQTSRMAVGQRITPTDTGQLTHFAGDIGLVRLEQRFISNDEHSAYYSEYVSPSGLKVDFSHLQSTNNQLKGEYGTTANAVLSNVSVQPNDNKAPVPYLKKSSDSSPHIALDNTVSFDGNGAIKKLSLCIWINCPSSCNDAVLISFDKGKYFELAITSAGKVSFVTAADNDTTSDVQSSVQVNDGQWHFITAVFDGADNKKSIYVDSALDSQQASGHPGHIGRSGKRYGYIGAPSSSATYGSVPANSRLAFAKGVKIGPVRMFLDALDETAVCQYMNEDSCSFTKPLERTFSLPEPYAFKHAKMVEHKGKLILFGMASDRRIYYAVCQPKVDENTRAEAERSGIPVTDASFWPSEVRQLQFPTELRQVGYSVLDDYRFDTSGLNPSGSESTYAENLFKKSTGDLSAPGAPFDVLSDGNNIILARQSASDTDTYSGTTTKIVPRRNEQPIVNSTLLIDRFIVQGDFLVTRLESRYQRSGNKYRAFSSDDSKSVKDPNGNYFVEPTHELPFINDLDDEQFSVNITPTSTGSDWRWTILATESERKLLRYFSIPSSSDGLFNTQGKTFYTSANPIYRDRVFQSRPGVDPYENKPLIPTQGKPGTAGYAVLLAENAYLKVDNPFYKTTPTSLTNGQPIDFSILFRFRAGKIPASTDGVVWLMHSHTDHHQYIWIDNANSLHVSVYGVHYKVESILGDLNWHQYAICFKEGVITVYVDAIPKSTSNYRENPPARPALGSYSITRNTFVFGGVKSAGLMDDLQIWSHSLNSNTLNAVTQIVPNTTEPGLKACYAFNEGSGSEVFDLSGEGRTATLQPGQGSNGTTLDVDLFWVKSSAKQHESTGLVKRLYQLTDADGVKFTDIKGLAIEHYQGEQVASASDTDRHSIIGDKRLMVTAQVEKSGVNDLATIDFCLDQDGTLANTTTRLPLKNISDPGSMSTSAVEHIRYLEKEVETHKANYDSAAGYLVTNRFLTKLGDNTPPPVPLMNLSKKFEYSCDLGYSFSDSNSSLKALVEGNSALLTAYNRAAVYDGNTLKKPPLDTTEIALTNSYSTNYRYILAGGTAQSFPANTVDYFSDTELGHKKLDGYCLFLDAIGEFGWSGQQARFIGTINNNPETYLWPSTVYRYSESSQTKKITVDPALFLLGLIMDLYFIYAEANDRLETFTSTYQSGKNLLMPIVGMDPKGLTVKGSLLNIKATTPPSLMQTGSGGLKLFYKNGSHRFESLSYMTDAERPIFILRAGNNDVMAASAPTTEIEYQNTRITISDHDSDKSLCKVLLTNTQLGLSETWNNVPRAAQKFATVLNGKAARLTSASNLAPDIVVYNYSSVTLESGGFLGEGSRLVKLAQKSSRGGDIKNVTDLAPTKSILSNRWSVGTLDRGIEFNGSNYLEDSATGKLPFDQHNDLTIEAWYKPYVHPDWYQTDVTPKPHPLLCLDDDDDGNKLELSLIAANQSGTSLKARLQRSGKSYLSEDAFPAAVMRHIAVVAPSSTGIRLTGNMPAITSAPPSNALTVNASCTIALDFLVDTVNSTKSLLECRDNFKIAIENNGKMSFEFTDTDNDDHKVTHDTSLEADKKYRVVVAINKEANINYSDMGDISGFVPTGSTVTVNDEAYVVNGVTTPPSSGGDTGNFKVTSKIYLYSVDSGVERALGSVKSGTFYVDGFHSSSTNTLEFGIDTGLTREISRLVIWGADLAASTHLVDIDTSNSDLAAYWKFDEKTGNRAYDEKTPSNGRYFNVPHTSWSLANSSNQPKLFVDGKAITLLKESTAHGHIFSDSRKVILGRTNASSNPQYAYGHLGELRVWKKARSQVDIIQSAFSASPGVLNDFALLYDFNLREKKAYNRAGTGFTLSENGTSDASNRLSVAPISNEGTPYVSNYFQSLPSPYHTRTSASEPVTCGFYNAVYLDDDNKVAGAMRKSAYASVEHGTLKVFTGVPVAELYTEWLSQGQTDPQIIGYSEGAPPVPGENLTSTGLILGEADSYGGSSSVNISTSDNDQYSWGLSRSDSGGVGLSVEGGYLFDFDANVEVAPLGFGVEFTGAKGEGGITGGISTYFGGGFSAQKALSSSLTKSQVFKQSLGGKWEPERADGRYWTPQRRFVPKNYGTALVESLTADIYGLRVRENKALVGMFMVPNADIPRDRNIITFPMNPNYIKQGTLDGKLGFTTADTGYKLVKDPDYPQSGSYGEYSYYKPSETYELVREVDDKQAKIDAEYESWNSAKLRTFDYSLGLPEAQQSSVVGYVDSSNSEESEYTPPKLVHAVDIYSRYIWTADGGMYNETSNYTESISESYSGSFNFKFGIKADYKLKALFGGVGFGIDIGATADASLTLSRSKSKTESAGFGLAAEVTPDRDLHLYTVNDAEKSQFGASKVGDAAFRSVRTLVNPGYPDTNYTIAAPILRPGKVDAYRGYTFFLQPSEDSFEHLRNQVIDPAWLLQNGSPSAVALRNVLKPGVQLADNEKQKPWRLLHRVTYVSRILPPSSGTPGSKDVMNKIGDKFTSNHQLLVLLEPYIYEPDLTTGKLESKVRSAVSAYLPEFNDNDSINYINQLFQEYLNIY
ncbi:LamG domain-containing protein [Sansalvadorimonas sp. 2012CJ34-2]|uniref:LamG domain-containing protein n=1 Tax=Parendozoicomonas callyspongiae TaxID=2942213 RepID=A0ABT0PDF4_9GAMM|nr:LamG domain-containing protein [Sansalvadorimonas sp. 2012CJ34-2]